MSSCQYKNKWNNQKIQKQFKNKRHSNSDDIDTWSSANSNHSTPFKNYCNAYHKNIYTNYNNQDELFVDEYETNDKYWRCDVCTYDNNECDMVCSICQSPFKSSLSTLTSSNNKQYLSNYITFGDYLPSKINNIINIEDDTDESVQIAIILSYKSNEIYQPYNETYVKNTNSKTTKTVHKLTKSEIERNRREKAKKRKARLEQQRRKYIAQKLNKLPKLKELINNQATVHRSISNTYRAKSFNIKLIVCNQFLSNFVSHKISDDRLKIVYHGTRSLNDNSIIEKGLVVGGTKGVKKANGSCYGTGVYCSPNISTARSYEKGSMFICVVKDKNVKKHSNNSIWVVPNSRDILPLYLTSFGPKSKPKPPSQPIITTPVRTTTRATTASTVTNVTIIKKSIIKFIPSFKLLNKKNTFNRRIQRKWSAYHKINAYVA